MISATIGPWATSATSTATEPEMRRTDHRDERAEEHQHADRKHERHLEDRRHDHDADRVDERDQHGRPDERVSERPGDPARRSRPARARPRGNSRTTQDQMRLPSARKKYVANSTMKKPATMWPTAVPTSVTRRDDLAVARRDGVLRGLDGSR